MSDHPDFLQFSLEPASNERLANLCGQLDTNLRQIERRLGVEIANRGNQFQVIGNDIAAQSARNILIDLYQNLAHEVIQPEQIHLSLQASSLAAAIQQDVVPQDTGNERPDTLIPIKTKRGIIKARGPNQQAYLKHIQECDINFGIGPAGTGKTYLAIACAVAALESERVRRLILVRPAVEAGEKLGFLPGDMAQKVDPYLRPMYDALYEMMGFDRVARLIERNIIEVAPLAFMRGRTLNDSFIILDEAQNTTIEQIKMFLTRVGFGSTVVITGDITQIDLPKSKMSGLRHVIEVLRNIDGISFTFFNALDVVRHPLVQRIVTAYEAYERNHPDNS